MWFSKSFHVYIAASYLHNWYLVYFKELCLEYIYTGEITDDEEEVCMVR